MIVNTLRAHEANCGLINHKIDYYTMLNDVRKAEGKTLT